MKGNRRLLSIVVVGMMLVGSSGCCTLAHSGRFRSLDDHRRDGELCPWLIGDAVLLIPGIVPGVIAFVVDFVTGEWRHASVSTGHGTGFADPAPAVVRDQRKDAAFQPHLRNA